MLSKLVTAIIVTLIAAVPTWYFSSLNITLDFANLPYLLVFVFLVSLISVWLGGRNNTPVRRRPRNDSYRDQGQRNTSGSSRESGSVKWFNASKGFGFITRDSGDDIFVHFRSIRGEGHRVLRDGQRVEFAVSEGDKGLQADDVVPAR